MQLHRSAVQQCGTVVPSTRSSSGRAVSAAAPQCSRRRSSSSSSVSVVAATARSNASHEQQQQAAPLAVAAAAAALVLQACLPVQQAAAASALAPLPLQHTVQQQQQQQHSSPLQQQQQAQQQEQQQRRVLGDLAFAAEAPAPAGEDDMTLAEIEADIMSEVALPPELRRFMEATQSGAIKSAKKLSEARRAVGFDRSPDGRVLLLSDDGEPFQVKNDMGVPGALLLRDAGGYCYYIPPSDSGALAQIDLSDDAIVAQLFANHAWEELVEPLEVMRADAPTDAPRSKMELQQPSGQLEQLRLSERQFRSVISLLSGAQDLPEQPLEELDAQEGGVQRLS